MRKGLEIYESREYRNLRNNICYHLRETGDKTIIRQGLEYRRKILEDAFDFTDANKEILRTFCTHLNDAVLSLYRKAWPLYEELVKARITEDITVVGYLNMTYPEMHPVQAEEEKRVWNALQVERYNLGIDTPFHIFLQEGEIDKYNEDAILRLQPKDQAWDEELPQAWDKDLPLTMLFHHWHTHSYYSLFDLMYIRNITGKLHIELDYIDQSKEL